MFGLGHNPLKYYFNFFRKNYFTDLEFKIETAECIRKVDAVS